MSWSSNSLVQSIAKLKIDDKRCSHIKKCASSIPSKSLSTTSMIERFNESPTQCLKLISSGGTCNRGKPHNKLRYLRYDNASKDLGITPERLLLDKSKNSKLIKRPKDSGMEPCKLLYPKDRFCRFCRPPTVVGISPVK
ncbi:hypothetical protein ACOSQ2_004379 [Xanthoceras sorbifolium]